MTKVKAVEREHIERVNRAFKYLEDMEAGWDKLDLALTIEDYEKVQGLGMAYALDRFIDVAEKRGLEPGAICATLLHDLCNRHKSCFLPRTSRY